MSMRDSMALAKFLLVALSISVCSGAKPLVIPDPAEKTFEYHFELDWKLTMAWFNKHTGLATLIKYDVDQSKYLVKVSDQNFACNATTDLAPGMDMNTVVKADGKHRRVIMINGIMPGPTMVVPHGSRVIIRLANRLNMEGLSIHFHGQDKRNEWFMDGVSLIQQCPISPGSDFVYKFTADTAGTHFYHGHLGSDRSEGVFGTFIVMPEDRSVQLHDGRSLVPDVEFPLILYDWNSVSGTDLWFNHVWRTMKFLYGYENEDECWRPTRMIDGTHIGGSYPFSGIIVNDKGWYNQDDILKRPYKLDIETYEVEEGSKTYLFRMINAGQAVGLMVSVEDHKLELVATDGAPVRGVLTDFIILYPGERYDFLLIAKQKADRPFYYLIVETLDYYDFYWNRMDPFYGLAKIQYRNEASNRLPDVNHTRCTADSICTVVNCPFPSFPNGFNRTCVNIENMQYVGTPEKEALQPSYSKNDPYEEYFLNFHYDNVMNGWLFKYPKGPPYFHPGNESQVMYTCTEDNWKGVRNSWCTYTLNITLGNVVQLVLYNTGTGGDMATGFHHPVHLHSTHFHVVKVGYGQYNQTTGFLETNNQDVPCANTEEQCDNLQWANSSWLNGNIPDMNLEYPVFKDTVVLPTGGYVVLRFKADNPGWWVMHCHIMVHHMGGMAIAIRVGEHEQMPKPPINFPRCGIFDPIYHDDQTTVAPTRMTTVDTVTTNSLSVTTPSGSGQTTGAANNSVPAPGTSPSGGAGWGVSSGPRWMICGLSSFIFLLLLI